MRTLLLTFCIVSGEIGSLFSQLEAGERTLGGFKTGVGWVDAEIVREWRSLVGRKATCFSPSLLIPW